MIFAIFNSLFTKICTSENGMIFSNDVFVHGRGFLEWKHRRIPEGGAFRGWKRKESEITRRGKKSRQKGLLEALLAVICLVGVAADLSVGI